MTILSFHPVFVSWRFVKNKNFLVSDDIWLFKTGVGNPQPIPGPQVIFVQPAILHWIDISLQLTESARNLWNQNSSSNPNCWLLQKYILPSRKYKNILTNAKLMISLFGSIYAWEQLFSKIEYIKNHLIKRLHGDHLNNVLLWSSTNISPDVEKLSHNKQ